MPSPTDFNLTPYYDDYSESKKFHRVLFRPSFAVQARVNTITNDLQIKSKASLYLKKEAWLYGDGFDLNYYAVKLSAKSVSDITKYVGVTLTGVTSGVVATCIDTSATDGTDPDTLFVKYTKTGTNNTALVFTDGETLNCTIDSAAATATVNTTATGSSGEIQKVP